MAVTHALMTMFSDAVDLCYSMFVVLAFTSICIALRSVQALTTYRHGPANEEACKSGILKLQVQEGVGLEF